MQSLSRRFLIGVGATSLALTALGSIAAFVVFKQELTQRELSFLGDYVRERSSNVEKRFATLSVLQNAAITDLKIRVDNISQKDADKLFYSHFPLQADGTRRSRDSDFDGSERDEGDYIYGMGGFLSHPEKMDADQRRTFAAAFDLVSDFGRASHAIYDNFYFFTPDTRLVIFAPDRPDHLQFYRHTAPATLDVHNEQMSRITLPQADPERQTRCTNLQRLVQQKAGARVGSACATPFYLKGRYMGSFGSSLDLSGFLIDAVRESLPGATTLITTRDGQLIASSRASQLGALPPEIAGRPQKQLELKALIQEVGRSNEATGIVDTPDGAQIAAFGRLAGPDWLMLEIYPSSSVLWVAVKSASWVLVIGLLAAVLQSLLVVRLARRTIVNPLQTLASSSGSGPKEPEAATSGAKVQAVEARSDEIGVLARTLRSEREKVEEVLASLEQRVQERTSALERANTEKSRFLANMSHELRTPLNGVIAISETLSRSQDTPRERELAELIVSSGRLLEKVLTDILDFSKIETGEIALSHEVFWLDDIVARIAELHRASAEAKGLSLDWSVGEDVSGAYEGDPVRITQVLSNLLSNAVKFTEQGHVSLEVRAAPDGVHFVVEDTGIGFDEAVRVRLFRRFEQADASIRRRFGGTGLGLAISRSLVELMGGRIEAASEAGKGSRFELILPLAHASANPEPEAGNETSEISLEGRRILLAEDHPTNQKVIQLILDVFGVSLDIVENGVQALERLKRARYDVVLMDMQMPEMDGLTATEALRVLEKAQNLPRTPVIMLTANALDEHIRASLDCGADEHLSKPVRADVLIEAIARAVQARDLQDLHTDAV